MIDWDAVPNFTPGEFTCKHTGRHGVKADLVYKLQEIRDMYGQAMQVNSGYRHPTHPDEAKKNLPPGVLGEHSMGLAADISVTSPYDRYDLITACLKLEVPRIGVYDTFIHIGVSRNKPWPVLWVR